MTTTTRPAARNATWDAIATALTAANDASYCALRRGDEADKLDDRIAQEIGEYLRVGCVRFDVAADYTAALVFTGPRGIRARVTGDRTMVIVQHLNDRDDDVRSQATFVGFVSPAVLAATVAAYIG